MALRVAAAVRSCRQSASLVRAPANAAGPATLVGSPRLRVLQQPLQLPCSRAWLSSSAPSASASSSTASATQSSSVLGTAATELNATRDAAPQLVQGLSNDACISMAAALLPRLAAAEPSSEAAAKAFALADRNKDGILSHREFAAYFLSTARGLQSAVDRATATGDAVAAAAATAAKSLAAPTSAQLRMLFMRGMVPMVGFGFVDNFIMLTAGDAIDVTFGSALQISTLAAAGLGNLVSDVAGLGLSSTIEATATKVGLPSPGLSSAQMELSKCRLVMTAASVVGITIGCLLGMVPLLFIDSHAKELKDLFDELDKDHNGHVSVDELRESIRSIGIDLSEEQVAAMTRKIGLPEGQQGLTFAQFKDFCEESSKFGAQHHPWYLFWQR